MGFSYFGGKKWRDITREERFFCAVAYYYLSKEPKDAVKWLNDKCQIGLDRDTLEADWEIGYEVALYRDYLYYKEEGFKDKEGRFRKRTFDLCCFSEKQIIIVEAKSFSGFENKQLEDFKKDRMDIPKVISPHLGVSIIALISSKYKPKPETIEEFDGRPLCWNDLFDKFDDPIFTHADDTYRPTKGSV